jgi:hypothetical protein
VIDNLCGSGCKFTWCKQCMVDNFKVAQGMALLCPNLRCKRMLTLRKVRGWAEGGPDGARRTAAGRLDGWTAGRLDGWTAGCTSDWRAAARLDGRQMMADGWAEDDGWRMCF